MKSLSASQPIDSTRMRTKGAGGGVSPSGLWRTTPPLSSIWGGAPVTTSRNCSRPHRVPRQARIALDRRTRARWSGSSSDESIWGMPIHVPSHRTTSGGATVTSATLGMLSASSRNEVATSSNSETNRTKKSSSSMPIGSWPINQSSRLTAGPTPSGRRARRGPSPHHHLVLGRQEERPLVEVDELAARAQSQPGAQVVLEEQDLLH